MQRRKRGIEQLYLRRCPTLGDSRDYLPGHKTDKQIRRLDM